MFAKGGDKATGSGGDTWAKGVLGFILSLPGEWSPLRVFTFKVCSRWGKHCLAKLIHPLIINHKQI